MLLCTVTWCMRYKYADLLRLNAPEASAGDGLWHGGSCHFVSEPQGV